MKFIKRILYAIHSVLHSTLMGWLTCLLAVFYFIVAQDLFWHGNEEWTKPARAILFNIPLFIYLAAIVVIFVYSFMKKKVEQRTAELTKDLEETTANETAESEDTKEEETQEAESETTAAN